MVDYWTENGIEKPQQVVVCAACRATLDGKTITLAGPRHFDSTMRSQMEAMDASMLESIGDRWEDGFINQFGEFLNRREAMLAALEAGQKLDIEYGCRGDTEILYSEALY